MANKYPRIYARDQYGRFKKSRSIVHWTIKITWDDKQEEYLSDIPDYCASYIDDYLTELEEEQL